MPLTNCDTTCSPIFGRKCKERKRKACECGKYAAYPATQMACVREYANSSTHKTLAEWECKSADIIFNETSAVVCNYDVEDNWILQQKNTASNATRRNELLITGAALLLLAGTLFLVPKIFKQ